MLFVYGDESTDESQQRVCAIAGIVGSELAWCDLERKWIERTGGIPFHANECDSDQGYYKDKPHADNKALYKDLAILLSKSEVGGVGIAIDLMAQQETWPGSGFDISFHKAFMHVFLKMKKYAELVGETLDFTFDSSEKSEYNAGLLYSTLRENEPGCVDVFSDKISFQFSKKNPRIQTADLLAREAMKALDNYIGPVKRPVRKSWNTLHETGNFIVEAYGREWFLDLKKDYDNIAKSVGYCQDDYIKWLKERKRHHNQSNLLLFIDRASKNLG